MKILVANLGSTSFKYRLFDLSDPAEPVLARGAIERIGSPSAKVVIKSTRGERELVVPIADHGEAVQLCLDQLTDPEIGVLRRRRRSRGDRLQGGPRAEPHRRAPGRRDGAGRDGSLRRRRPGAQSAVHQGDADAPRAVPRAPAGRRVRDRLPPHDSRGQPALRHPRRSGRPSSASAAGGSTAPATATSPAGCPSCWAEPTSS